MTSYKPKSLMELLLAKKIEAAAAEGSALAGRRLLRTDSMDSVSSIGSCTSSMLGEDVCRCDDCILGIVDLYVIPPQTKGSLTKKVNNTTTACPPLDVQRFLNANKSSNFVFIRTCIIMLRVNTLYQTGDEAITGLFQSICKHTLAYSHTRMCM